jgi:DNA polymerase family A/3'-5' exonuclease
MTIKHVIALDGETYWDRDYTLRKLSVPEYVLHPKFKLLLLAVYDFSWDAPRWLPAEAVPDFLQRYPPAETMAIAHNMLFDGAILAWRYNWLPVKLLDTLGMARALYQFKRNSLGALAKELKLGQEKDEQILKTTQGLDVAGIKRLEQGIWEKFCQYAMDDVVLCMKIFARLYRLFPKEEQEVMNLVLRAALEPKLHADVLLLRRHLEELRLRKARLLRDCGYEKAALMSTAQFKEALEGLGVEIKTKVSPTGNIIPAFAKTDSFMQELCEYHGSYDDEINFKVQSLATARLAHKSTIEETRTEKFINIASLRWPGNKPLLPVPLRYGGAHTHRLSGEWGLNMQNLPRDKEKSQLRSAIIAPPGFKIVTADLAQIECRLLAKFADQQDLLAQFRNGEDVYANFGQRIFNRVITKKDDPSERWIAKTAVLGLGYGCGPARFYNMVVNNAYQLGIPLAGLNFDTVAAERIVKVYRRTFHRIQALWWQFDGYLTHLSSNPLMQVQCGPVWLSSWRDREYMEIRLPIGPVGQPLTKRVDLFLRYKGTRDDKSSEVVIKDLYGAKLTENIIQTLARVVVMQAALRLGRLGYKFVMQAHDELTFLIPESRVTEACKIISLEMTRTPEWMKGLPLAVEIGVGDNYGSCK